jgi:hypothetical protein
MVITVIIVVIARMIYSAWQDRDQVSSNLSLFTTIRYPFDEVADYCALLLSEFTEYRNIKGATFVSSFRITI